MRKVMIFGVFDGVHAGHRAFLRQAKKEGDYLIAVVTPDQMAHHLKGHYPKRDYEERMDHLRREDYVNEVVVGDEEIGVWRVVKRHKPDLIALGYDQEKLGESLSEHFAGAEWLPEIKVMSAHEPERFKSSLLNGT